MKKILVAVDIARTGGNDAVIQTAKDLAGVVDGEVAMLYVIEPTPTYVMAKLPGDIVVKRREESEAQLADVAKAHGIATAAVREGAPATEILDYAEKVGADLIVLHSHDPDLSNYFIGSVASRVVRHAHCSVHVVRHAHEGR